MEVAMRLGDFCLTRHRNSVVLDPDQRDFSGDTNYLQMNDSSRYKPNITLDRIDDTRSNITVEEDDLLDSGKKFQPGNNVHHCVRPTERSKGYLFLILTSESAFPLILIQFYLHFFFFRPEQTVTNCF